jgi:hypothetical protein
MVEVMLWYFVDWHLLPPPLRPELAWERFNYIPTEATWRHLENDGEGEGQVTSVLQPSSPGHWVCESYPGHIIFQLGTTE